MRVGAVDSMSFEQVPTETGYESHEAWFVEPFLRILAEFWDERQYLVEHHRPTGPERGPRTGCPSTASSNGSQNAVDTT